MNENKSLVLSEKRIQIIVWALLILFPILGMVIDLVSPSLPAIERSLHASSKMAKDVISIYLFGCGLGNFVTGFLTDALGRRKLICIALLGFVVISLIPVFFNSIEVLLLARFLQGITIGAVSVLARAIFSDLLSPEKLVRLGTLIGTMWGLGPIMGPVIGGYLQTYLGWKAGFCFLAFVSFLEFIVIFFIVPETHLNRHPLNMRTIKHNLIEVTTHRMFIGLAILMGLTYSLLIVFNTAGPFLIQTRLHYSPLFFGHLALWLGLTFLVATFLSRYFIKKYPVEQILVGAASLFFSIVLCVAIASYSLGHSIVVVTIATALMYFACGLLFPMSMGKGVSLFRHIAGTATATMYLINMLITSSVGFLVSYMHIQSATQMIWIYCALLFSVLVTYGVFIRHR